jgi:CRP/FNR family transcriptional regulator
MDQESSAFVADSNLIQVLEKRSLQVSCDSDQVLFCQGEAPTGVYILRSGEAALIMTSEAGEVVMCLRAAAGSLLGLPAIIGNEPYTLTAKARKGSDVRFVSRDDFEDLMRAEPSLTLNVLKVLATEVRAARKALAEFKVHTSEETSTRTATDRQV